MKLLASLDLVERNDHRLEEVDVLLSQWHCESGNDGGQDIQQLRGSVEPEVLVDESVEAIRDGLSDHLSPWHQLGVKPVQDILQVLSLFRLLRVKQLQELLDELVRDEGLEALHIGGVVDNQLEEKLVDRLQVWPGRVHDNFFFLDTHLVRPALLHHWERTENILLDHFHNSVEVWNHEVDDVVLVGQQVAELGDVLESLVLLGDHLVVVVEIEDLAAELNFLEEVLLTLYSSVSISRIWCDESAMCQAQLFSKKLPLPLFARLLVSLAGWPLFTVGYVARFFFGPIGFMQFRTFTKTLKFLNHTDSLMVNILDPLLS